MAFVRGKFWQRYSAGIKCALWFVILCGVLAQLSIPAFADTAGTPAPAERPSFFQQILANLFNSRGLLDTLGQPEYAVAAFITMNIIVFVETGLLIGFFLPGDSLLVTAGLICATTNNWHVGLLILTLCASAIIGDSVGYSIGFKTGPKIFCREKSLFFNKHHLLKAQEFYEKHGGKTIILARFIPILRTFAPVVAGVGQMQYRRFLFYNVFGGVGWVTSMVLLGYSLPFAINPLCRQIFGEHFDVRDYIEIVIVLVVLASISPGIIVWLRSRLKGTTPPAAPVAAESVSDKAVA